MGICTIYALFVGTPPVPFAAIGGLSGFLLKYRYMRPYVHVFARMCIPHEDFQFFTRWEYYLDHPADKTVAVQFGSAMGLLTLLSGIVMKVRRMYAHAGGYLRAAMPPPQRIGKHQSERMHAQSIGMNPVPSRTPVGRSWRELP